MSKGTRILAALGLAAAVAAPLAVYAASHGNAASHGKAATTEAAAQGYVCPLTGEELPCPNCCPLNQKK